MSFNNKPLIKPIITSLAFNKPITTYLPFSYDFSIQQIQQIKKYLPKNLFKLHGIDISNDNDKYKLSKQDEQQLTKSKIKIKAINGKWTQNNQLVNYLPKQQVRVIQWYNKSINLAIPYSSKSTQAQIQQQLHSYIQYYIDNFIVFKNTLNDQLYHTSTSSVQNKLTVQQLSTETDIMFLQWTVEKDPNDDQQQIIRVNVPILLCLNINQKYSLTDIKALLKIDILSSISSVQLKHQFNTRVLIQGKHTKQYICLNSYCNQQTALNEEEKLRAIIGQQSKVNLLQQQTQQTILSAKKDHKFLIIILAMLVLIYFYLKIFPIHGRNDNQYIKQTYTDDNYQQAQQFATSGDQSIF